MVFIICDSGLEDTSDNCFKIDNPSIEDINRKIFANKEIGYGTHFILRIDDNMVVYAIAISECFISVEEKGEFLIYVNENALQGKWSKYEVKKIFEKFLKTESIDSLESIV